MTINPTAAISAQITNMMNGSEGIVNFDEQRLGNIKSARSPKEQLKKVSKEFEAIFVTKMLNTMDKTVDKENGIFGQDDQYMKKFKSFIYDEIGRDIAKNPLTSIGFATQIYSQMERYLPPEPAEADLSEKAGRISAPNPEKPDPKQIAQSKFERAIRKIEGPKYTETVFDEEL